MAIQFMNIRTGERRELKDPHQIAAYLNSSDLHVNSNLGQDFGWRLAPSLVHRIDKMRNDPRRLEEISRRTGVGMEDLTTVHLVHQISYEDGITERASKQSTGGGEPKFKAQYEAELEEMRKKEAAKNAPKESKKKKTTKKSDDDKKDDDKKDDK